MIGPHFGGARFVGPGARFAAAPFAPRGMHIAGLHHGPFFHHGHFFHHRHHFRRFAIGFIGPYSYYDYPYYYDDCYQLRHVPTRYGWRWVRVNVCG
jgi:hypothetical protein